jgi:hypothetical protein
LVKVTRMKPLLIGLFAVVLTGCLQPSGRRWTPLAVALVTPAQLPPESWDVYGLKLDLLAGKCHDMKGLAVGWFSFADDVAGMQITFGATLSESNAYGLQVGAVSIAEREMIGLQAGGVNIAGSKMASSGSQESAASGRAKGMQLSFWVNAAEEVSGVQLSGGAWVFVMPGGNEAARRLSGAQFAAIGINRAGEMRGVQVAGLGNKAETASGVQIGLVANFARRLSGVQIGLLNFNKGGRLPFFPFVNIGARGPRSSPPRSPGTTGSRSSPGTR